MSSPITHLPDISVEYVDGDTGGEYEVTADFTDHNTERERVTYRSRSLETALREVGSAIYLIEQFGDVDTDPVHRGQKAAEAIADCPGVVRSEYQPHMREVWVTLTTLDTDIYSNVTWFAQLEEDWWTLDYRREHGLVIDIEYGIREFAPPLPDDKAWGDLLSEDGPIEALDLAYLVDLHDEYEGEREVVSNPEVRDGTPRVAGTEMTANHVYYLVEYLEYDADYIIDHIYPLLDAEDVEVALEYAYRNEDTAEAYAEERLAESRMSLDELRGDADSEPSDFVPLNGDE